MGAPTFKEQIAADISTTFLNRLEFADTHTVNGKEMAAVVDDNELLERDKARSWPHRRRAHTRPGVWFMWQRLILAPAPPRASC